ncbi:MAG TPA: 3-hydroxyacyl-CoA dehydrogenase family protein [Baekduia sp.]|uniref:3-hydroxyacyl-CoA dehydrogenase family protein n=1 Tax=Baekduia sp. TaxID=2600305 RepID=UPI002D78543D|nr:3-hydroxyacyl-CoA dehydrogenase family protein [Baekduia sp.]HET6507014.1 3-hydroxyacyl-CoA dehydrogenase family protein [Baekduia sp.]
MPAAESIQKVVVVGGGIMGNGIAQVIAQAGLDVTIVDVAQDALDRARARIDKSLARAVKAGRLAQEDADATSARIATSTDLEAVAAEADHAIETVVEILDVKREVLSRLDALCREDVILASNTSQFSISTLAAGTGRPDRVIGSHWFNPPPVMDLIEIIRGVETSDATLETTLALAERYGRQTVVCEKDTPGFITSRLIVLLGLEAMRIVEEGIASVEDVNKACRLAFNHAMGPLDTMDFSGLDTAMHVADAMRDQYGERFLAPQNLRSLVNGGHLGAKTGRGFSEFPARS